MESHCCFCTNTDDFVPSARIHVPLAKKCSMGCAYCNYRLDKNISDEFNRPGVSSKTVTSAAEIETYVISAMERYLPNVVGVSGPGEALENFKQLEYLQLFLLENYPSVSLCICSNGRFFDMFADKLVTWKNLKYFTLTINSLNVDTIKKLYFSVHNDSDAERLISNQTNAVRVLSKSGVKIKVNIVYIPGINDSEIEDICYQLDRIGVDCFNIIPVVYSSSDKLIEPSANYDIDQNVEIVKTYLKEKNYKITCLCRRCRADFCGF